MNRLVLWNGVIIKRRFVLLLIVLLLTLLWYGLVKYRPWDIIIPVAPALRKLPDYEFQQVVLRDVSGARTFYRISANTLTLDKTQGLLEQVTGSILENNNPVFDFIAQRGVLSVAKRTVTFQDFSGWTSGRFYPPWRIDSPLVYWDNTMQSFTFDKKPKLASRDLLISASKIVYNQIFNFFLIGNDCEVRRGDYILQSDRAVLKNAIDVLTLEDNVALQGSSLNGRADLADWDIRQDTVRLRNNVVVQTDDVVLTGTLVALNSRQNTVQLQGDVRLRSKSATDDILVNTDRAVWNRQTEKIEFFENTRAWKNNSLIQSDQLVYDFAKKDVAASGTGRTTIIQTTE
ncbi:hypothetical protein NO2_0908 [Candidatus Termititenax persephonae]|uniref:Organic solvent tolerance-like N-terminal domain-containing protein n=1 Tax=Candidatus Termititenax persephonae TaxID=2218525 RepID=A0A388TGT4_9BACT|nr:hypothetical protein NO2_0908 [Candidatus Termititenax persephonae]